MGEVASTSKRRCVDSTDASWHSVASGAELELGDVVRYHILLIDAWAGQSRRSPQRTASVEKLILGEGSSGPLVVLRHADGALDCIEASQLRGLKVRDRIH